MESPYAGSPRIPSHVRRARELIACTPYPANLSGTVADLAARSYRVQGEPPWATLVGVRLVSVGATSISKDPSGLPGRGQSVTSEHVLMTVPSQEDFGSLHEGVLRFMGAFASVNFAIDSVVGIYLRRRMSDLGVELAKQVLHRISDEQRKDLFRAFAAEAGYMGELTHFGTIYNRAKALRDMVGHSLNVSGPVYSGGKPIVAIANTLSPTEEAPRS